MRRARKYLYVAPVVHAPRRDSGWPAVAPVAPAWRICGLEFAEFIAAGTFTGDLLLLAHDNFPGTRVLETGMMFVRRSDIPALAASHIPELGDFNWVDCHDDRALSRLTPLEQAELLMFGHLRMGTESPALLQRIARKLRSSLFFSSHDGGWMVELQVLRPKLFAQILCRSLVTKCRRFTGHRLLPWLPPAIAKRFLALARTGIFCSLQAVRRGRRQFAIPFLARRGYNDPDFIFPSTHNRVKGQVSGELIFNGRRWTLVLADDRVAVSRRGSR